MGILDSLNGIKDSVVDAIEKNGLDAVNPFQLSQSNSQSSVVDLSIAIENFQQNTRALSTATQLMSRGLRLEYIQPEDWNRVFPYSFIILSLQGGKYVKYSGLEVVLPITPQDLNVSTPFASTVTVTSRGILEENNAAPLRNISFTASTGVFIRRPSFSQTSPDHSLIGTVFAGTIAAVNNVASSFRAIAGSNITASGGNQLPSEEVITSGYYQYHLIRSFLELYADMKKRPDGGQYRLAFQMSKDKMTYLVTPQMFNVKRSASSPLEYLYTFQGIAWGAVPKDQIQFDSASDGPSAGSQSLVNNIGDYQAVLNTLRNARGLIQKAKDVVTAIKTDIDVNVIGPMNNVILALKEAISIPATIADLPSQIQSSFQQNVIRQANDLFDQIPPNLQGQFKSATNTSASTQSTQAQGSFNVEVATTDSVLTNVDFTDSISTDSLQLTKSQQDAVATAKLNALSITNNDINNLINQLQATVTALEPTAISQGDDSPIWPIMYALQSSQSGMYSLLSSNTFGPVSTANQQSGVSALINFYAETTAASGIDFTTPQSKIAIPCPFKVSLERIAQQYLGDATRWIEIVSVNNLSPPYIDEDGFTYSFLSNGDGNQFNVSTTENLFNEQIIMIGSDTQPIQTRKIKIIQEISSTNWLITVDGDDTLGDFTVNEHAFMKAFLPNTVNSQKMLYIPVDAPSTIDNTVTKPLPFINEDPALIKLSKIDLLLDQNNDLAVTADGTWNLAFGKANLIQAAKLKLTAAVGGVILHPQYGAKPEVGDSIADVSVTDIRNRIVDAFKKDERYTGVKSIQVVEDEDALNISLVVPVASTGTELPLSFDLET